jgi:hypothetical protein
MLFCALAWAAGPALAQVTLPSGYTFTPIVVGNTFTAPLSVGSGAPLAFPGINNQGTVAFEANSQLVNGTYTAYGFYTGNGSGAPTAIATSSSIINLTNTFLSINDTGVIGFLGCSGATSCAPPNGNGVDTVYSSNGAVTNTLATGFRWSAFQLDEGPDVAINNAGAVAFREPTTGSSVIIADASGARTIASGFQAGSVGYDVSINNQGVVAFTGTDANNLTGIFTSNGTTVTTIAHEGGIFGQLVLSGGSTAPSINDSGAVAFAATNVPPIPPNGVNGVFTSDGTTSGIITTSTASVFQNIAINNTGVVAFLAAPPTALLIGAAGDTPETVIQTGDAVAGSTVTGLFIGPNSINGVGQIAFWASLADGRTGIFRADPSAGTGTPDNPVLPVAVNNGVFVLPLALCLSGVQCHGGTFTYFDPPADVAGYNYTVDPTSSPFDGVVLPVGLGLGLHNNYYVLTLFNSRFKLYLPTLYILTGGVPFHFATAGLKTLHTFGILGVNPAADLDPTNVKAFPTGLTFMPGPIVGNLQMAPVAYPSLVAGH